MSSTTPATTTGSASAQPAGAAAPTLTEAKGGVLSVSTVSAAPKKEAKVETADEKKEEKPLPELSLFDPTKKTRPKGFSDDLGKKVYTLPHDMSEAVLPYLSEKERLITLARLNRAWANHLKPQWLLLERLLAYPAVEAIDRYFAEVLKAPHVTVRSLRRYFAALIDLRDVRLTPSVVERLPRLASEHKAALTAEQLEEQLHAIMTEADQMKAEASYSVKGFLEAAADASQHPDTIRSRKQFLARVAWAERAFVDIVMLHETWRALHTDRTRQALTLTYNDPHAEEPIERVDRQETIMSRLIALFQLRIVHRELSHEGLMACFLLLATYDDLPILPALLASEASTIFKWFSLSDLILLRNILQKPSFLVIGIRDNIPVLMKKFTEADYLTLAAYDNAIRIAILENGAIVNRLSDDTLLTLMSKLLDVNALPPLLEAKGQETALAHRMTRELWVQLSEKNSTLVKVFVGLPRVTAKLFSPDMDKIIRNRPLAVRKLLDNPTGVARLEDSVLEYLRERYTEGNPIPDIASKVSAIQEERAKAAAARREAESAQAEASKREERIRIEQGSRVIDTPSLTVTPAATSSTALNGLPRPPHYVSSATSSPQPHEGIAVASSGWSTLMIIVCAVMVLGGLSAITGGIALGLHAAWAWWPLGIGIGLFALGALGGIFVRCTATPASRADQHLSGARSERRSSDLNPLLSSQALSTPSTSVDEPLTLHVLPHGSSSIVKPNPPR